MVLLAGRGFTEPVVSFEVLIRPRTLGRWELLVCPFGPEGLTTFRRFSKFLVAGTAVLEVIKTSTLTRRRLYGSGAHAAG